MVDGVLPSGRGRCREIGPLGRRSNSRVPGCETHRGRDRYIVDRLARGNIRMKDYASFEVSIGIRCISPASESHQNRPLVQNKCNNPIKPYSLNKFLLHRADDKQDDSSHRTTFSGNEPCISINECNTRLAGVMIPSIPDTYSIEGKNCKMT